MGPSGSCAGPSLPIWRVDEQSLRTTAVAELRPAGGPCAGQGPRAVAVAGNSIFLLSGSVLYWVTQPAHEPAVRNKP